MDSSADTSFGGCDEKRAPGFGVVGVFSSPMRLFPLPSAVASEVLTALKVAIASVARRLSDGLRNAGGTVSGSVEPTPRWLI